MLQKNRTWIKFERSCYTYMLHFICHTPSPQSTCRPCSDSSRHEWLPQSSLAQGLTFLTTIKFANAWVCCNWSPHLYRHGVFGTGSMVAVSMLMADPTSCTKQQIALDFKGREHAAANNCSFLISTDLFYSRQVQHYKVFHSSGFCSALSWGN